MINGPIKRGFFRIFNEKAAFELDFRWGQRSPGT